MERTKLNQKLERKIIINMITSAEFLRDVQLFYKPKFLKVAFMRTVAGWCIEYWDKYEKCPGIHIQDIFNSKREDSLDEDTAELIEEFLQSISEEYENTEHINFKYLLTKTETLFRERSLELMTEDVKTMLLTKDVTGAEDIIGSFKQVSRPTNTGIDPFENMDKMREAIEESDQFNLFSFKGELGKFIGPIARTDFISFMGPEKRGKSYWLQEAALTALMQMNNVAYIVVGDMPEREVMLRLGAHITRTNTTGDLKNVLVPVLDCINNQMDTCNKPERACEYGSMHQRSGEIIKATIEELPDYKPCTNCREDFEGAYWHELKDVPGITVKSARQEARKIIQRRKGKKFKLACFSSMSIKELDSLLSVWENYEDFTADVVVVDYLDNVDNERQDFRHGENDKWRAARAIALDRDCAFITATQSDAASYDSKSIKMSNFSEDKRKLGHVTKIITLNQTDIEKDDKVIRLGRIAVRKGGSSGRKYIKVLECREQGRAYINSF